MTHVTSTTRTKNNAWAIQKEMKILVKIFIVCVLAHLTWSRENVSHAPHGLNVIVTRVAVSEFFSQLAHVHINAAVKRRKLAAQHRIHKPLASDHPTGFAQ